MQGVIFYAISGATTALAAGRADSVSRPLINPILLARDSAAQKAATQGLPTGAEPSNVGASVVGGARGPAHRGIEPELFYLPPVPAVYPAEDSDDRVAQADLFEPAAAPLSVGRSGAVVDSENVEPAAGTPPQPTSVAGGVRLFAPTKAPSVIQRFYSKVFGAGDALEMQRASMDAISKANWSLDRVN